MQVLKYVDVQNLYFNDTQFLVQDYYQTVCSWEYGNISKATLAAIDISTAQAADSLGVTILFVDEEGDISEFPSTELKYYHKENRITKGLYDLLNGEGAEDLLVEYKTTHNATWSYHLGIEDNRRLMLVYTGKVLSGEEQNKYINNLKENNI